MQESHEVAEEVKSIIRSAGTEEDLERISVEPRPLKESFQNTRENGRKPVIAEYKPTSPTTEGIDERSPAEAARKMEKAGAAAISVLTEEDHFKGST